MEAVTSLLKLADACDEKVASFYNSVNALFSNLKFVKQIEIDAVYDLARQYGCADIGGFTTQLRDEMVKRFVKRFAQPAGLLDGGMV